MAALRITFQPKRNPHQRMIVLATAPHQTMIVEDEAMKQRMIEQASVIDACN